MPLSGVTEPSCSTNCIPSYDATTPLYVQLLAAEVYLIRLGDGRLRVSVCAILSTTKETGYTMRRKDMVTKIILPAIGFEELGTYVGIQYIRKH